MDNKMPNLQYKGIMYLGGFNGQFKTVRSAVSLFGYWFKKIIQTTKFRNKFYTKKQEKMESIKRCELGVICGTYPRECARKIKLFELK